MRYPCVLCLAVALSASTAAYSEDAGAGSKDAAKQPAAAAVQEGTLSDAQIAAFKTEASDEKAKTKTLLQATFDAATVKKEDTKKYAESGKIPIRITCQLIETKGQGGRRLSGDMRLYVKDSDGNVVIKPTTLPLDKMCPS